MLREMIIFAAGGMIGAGATVLIMRKRYDKKYNELLKDAIDSDADFRLKEAEKILAHAKAVEAGYIQSSGEEKPDENDGAGESKDDVTTKGVGNGDRVSKNENVVGKKPYVDYTAYYEAKADSEYPRDEYDMAANDAFYEGMKSNEERKQHKKPKIVTRSEFDSPEYEHFTKTTLYFYTEDEVLTTEETEPEENEVIEDPSRLIGDALTKFGFNKNDEEVIYVRNYELETDYVIEKWFKAYAESSTVNYIYE